MFKEGSKCYIFACANQTEIRSISDLQISSDVALLHYLYCHRSSVSMCCYYTSYTLPEVVQQVVLFSQPGNEMHSPTMTVTCVIFQLSPIQFSEQGIEVDVARLELELLVQCCLHRETAISSCSCLCLLHPSAV